MTEVFPLPHHSLDTYFAGVHLGLYFLDVVHYQFAVVHLEQQRLTDYIGKLGLDEFVDCQHVRAFAEDPQRSSLVHLENFVDHEVAVEVEVHLELLFVLLQFLILVTHKFAKENLGHRHHSYLEGEVALLNSFCWHLVRILEGYYP